MTFAWCPRITAPRFRRVGVWVGVLLLAGCSMFHGAPPPCGNPVFIPPLQEDFVWDQVVDVVDDYFQVDQETRVRRVGDVLTEGQLESFPLVGSTLLEPWRHDSADGVEKLESTLQTIRRRAVVRVTPDVDGYQLDVAVYKELEDLPRPENATAGAAAFRHDSSPRGFDEPVGGQQVSLGWIPQGRDNVLEQRILSQIQARLASPGGGVPGPGPPPGY